MFEKNELLAIIKYFLCPNTIIYEEYLPVHKSPGKASELSAALNRLHISLMKGDPTSDLY